MAKAGEVNRETVEVLLQTVKDFLADEDSRAQSLNARATGLAGFVGLIVSLAAVVGRADSAEFSRRLQLTLGVLLIAALVLLLGAVLTAVLFVLLPKGYQVIASEEVDQYPTYRFVSEDTVMAQGRLMTGLVKTLAIERQRNSVKATALKLSYFLVGLGITCIAAGGLILAVHEFL
jgi:hypothetical protein